MRGASRSAVLPRHPVSGATPNVKKEEQGAAFLVEEAKAIIDEGPKNDAIILELDNDSPFTNGGTKEDIYSITEQRKMAHPRDSVCPVTSKNDGDNKKVK